jgi:hypothetical protein
MSLAITTTYNIDLSHVSMHQSSTPSSQHVTQISHNQASQSLPNMTFPSSEDENKDTSSPFITCKSHSSDSALAAIISPNRALSSDNVKNVDMSLMNTIVPSVAVSPKLDPLEEAQIWERLHAHVAEGRWQKSGGSKKILGKVS